MNRTDGVPPPIVARVNSPPPPEDDEQQQTVTGTITNKQMVHNTIANSDQESERIKQQITDVIVDITNQLVDADIITTATDRNMNKEYVENRNTTAPETTQKNNIITTSTTATNVNTTQVPLAATVVTEPSTDVSSKNTISSGFKDVAQFIFRMPEVPVILKKYLLSKGWKEWSADYCRDDEWNLRWKSGRYRPTEYKTPREFQRMNHFPKSSIITKKDTMLRALRKSKAIHGNVYSFFPDSFILPTEYTKFIHRYAEQEKPELWICKPDGSSRGRGIFLIKDLSDLHYDQQYIVQRYIDRPLCVGGYKMDLRVYVLVRSFKPLKAFIYRDGLARFGTEKYNEDPNGDIKNLYSHLTNASINKFSKTFWTDKDVIGAGCKWTFGQLREWFETTGRDWELMWARLRNVISLTLLTAVKAVPRNPWCFELFGFDIMLDEALKPWLIEVNCSPALGTTEKADYDVKEPLLKDMIHLLDIKPVDFSNLNTKKNNSGCNTTTSSSKRSLSKTSSGRKNARAGKNARERFIKNRTLNTNRRGNNNNKDSRSIQNSGSNSSSTSKENIPQLTEEELNLKLKSYHVPETNYEKLFPFNEASEHLATKMNQCDDDMGIANVQRDIVKMLRMEQKILKLRQKKIGSGSSIVQKKLQQAKEIDTNLNG